MKWFKRSKKKPHRKNEALLSLISQYIEENYEGYSYRDAYHFPKENDLAVEEGFDPFERSFALNEEPPTIDALINISEDEEWKVNRAPSASPESSLPTKREQRLHARRTPRGMTEDDPFDDIFKIFPPAKPAAEPSADASSDQLNRIKDLLEERGHIETFTEHMLRIISEKGYTEAEVYHRVFMDRKLFNKIRNTPDYQPSKRTALLIVIALKLSVPEAQELLEKAGYALTHCSKTDLIVECCLLQGVHDIFEINDMLDAFGMPLLSKCD